MESKFLELKERASKIQEELLTLVNDAKHENIKVDVVQLEKFEFTPSVLIILRQYQYS